MVEKEKSIKHDIMSVAAQKRQNRKRIGILGIRKADFWKCCRRQEKLWFRYAHFQEIER